MSRARHKKADGLAKHAGPVHHALIIAVGLPQHHQLGEGTKTSAHAGKRKRGGRLTASDRQHLPTSDFALPGKGSGPKGAGAGSYPIPDASHARNALARVSQHGSPAEKARVRAKVHRKFPDIGQK